MAVHPSLLGLDVVCVWNNAVSVASTALRSAFSRKGAVERYASKANKSSHVDYVLHAYL
jgi:hypothetical protein